MINDSIQILRLNAEYDALIHASRPLLTPGDPNTDKATKWIQILSKPVHNISEASDRVKKARGLLRKLKSKEFISEPFDLGQPSPPGHNFFENSFGNHAHTGQHALAPQSHVAHHHHQVQPRQVKSYPFLDTQQTHNTHPNLPSTAGFFDTGYSTQNQKMQTFDFDLASNVSSVNTDLNHPKFSQIPNSISETGDHYRPQRTYSAREKVASYQTATDTAGSQKIPELTPQNSYQIATSMHEYKLQLQRASDLAMEKIIERKNQEILDMKSDHHNSTSNFTNEIHELKLARDTFKNQVEEFSKQADFLKSQVTHASSEKSDFKNKILNLGGKISKLENDKQLATSNHQQQLQEIVDSTTNRLQSLEKSVQNRDKEHANSVSKFQNEVESLTESKSLSEDLITDLKAKVEQLNRKSLSDNSSFNSQLMEKDKAFIEAMHEEKHKYNTLEANNILKTSEIESAFKRTISEKTSEIQNITSQNRELSDKLIRAENQVESFQKEIDEILEQADEKMTSMKLEREEALGKAAVETENAITDIRNRMVREKQSELSNLKRDFDSDKRLLHLDFDKKSDIEHSKFKNLQEKLEVTNKNQSNLLTEFEKDKSKIIQEFTARLDMTSDALDAVRNEKMELKLAHDKHINSLSKTHDRYISEMKELNNTLNLDLEKEKSARTSEKGTCQLEARNQAKRISTLEQEVFIANENFSQSEDKCETLNNELNLLEKKRRQQLLELGILREQEKQDSEKRHFESFQKAEAKLRNEMSIKLEDRLNNLRKKHRKELECLDVQLKEVERRYRDKCNEHEKRKQEFNLAVNELKSQKKKLEREFSDKLNDQKLSFEDLIHREKSNNEDKLTEAGAELQLEKTRLERAERRLQQAELAHRNEIDDLKMKFSRETEDLLPKTVQYEFESTINHLRDQVNGLHKTVKNLVAKHKVGNLVGEQGLQGGVDVVS